jgi:penicillin-binding protein 1A
VTTTLDATAAGDCGKTLERGLRAYDKRHGWRKPARNRAREKHTIDGFKDERWTGRWPSATSCRRGRHGAEDGRRAPAIRRLRADLERAGYAWTRRRRAPTCSSRATSSMWRSRRSIPESRTASVTLEQTPVVEGALVAIDNRTGQIKAMVGGWSFSRSKFNRAVQAYRQLGSTFKPFVYTAAIDRGFTPTSILDDTPVSYQAGNGQVWSPQNYDHKFEGPVTLRWALEESRNIPAIKMMDTLGPKNVLEYAKRFGFEEDFPPTCRSPSAPATRRCWKSPAPTRLPESGRADEADLDPVGEGPRRQPARREPQRADRRDSRRHGVRHDQPAARRADARHRRRAINMAGQWPLAGKTGTVDDNTDAWFVGFDPDITVGVWVGFDDKTQVARDGRAGSFVALPMWMEFMQAYIDGRETRTRRRPSKRRGTSCFSRSTSRTARCRRPTAPA